MEPAAGARMSRRSPDRTPILVGGIWENPVTKERATILERPWDNALGRATAELTALVGARVWGNTAIRLSSINSPCSSVR